jgi:hypothetical protein
MRIARLLPPRRFALVVLALCLVSGSVSFAGQKEDKSKRPKITIKAQPTIGRAPLRVVFSAELIGGADDFEEYYCPTVLWEWGKGDASETKTDCPPYEPGVSSIKRRYTVEHTFRNFGTFRVYFSLIHRDREVAHTSINIVVHPGGNGSFDPDGQ